MQRVLFSRMRKVTAGTTLQLFCELACVVLTVVIFLSFRSPFCSAEAASQELWQQNPLDPDGFSSRYDGSIASNLDSGGRDPLLNEAEEPHLRESTVKTDMTDLGAESVPEAVEVPDTNNVESGNQWNKFMQKAGRWVESKFRGEKATQMKNRSFEQMGKLASKVRGHRWTSKLKEALKKEEVQLRLFDLATAAAVMGIGTILSTKRGPLNHILGSAIFLTGTINAAKALAGIGRGAIKRGTNSQPVIEDENKDVDQTK